jgi:hypothetical protein
MLAAVYRQKPAAESANLVHAPLVLSLSFAPAPIVFSPL